MKHHVLSLNLTKIWNNCIVNYIIISHSINITRLYNAIMILWRTTMLFTTICINRTSARKLWPIYILCFSHRCTRNPVITIIVIHINFWAYFLRLLYMHIRQCCWFPLLYWCRSHCFDCVKRMHVIVIIQRYASSVSVLICYSIVY